MNNKTEQKIACYIPWVSIWPTPQGQVYPCCAAKNSHALIGNLKEDRLKNIFNSSKMKELRLKFLTGKVDPIVCQKCVKREKAQGSSMRTMINKLYSDKDEFFKKKTNLKGEFSNFKILFLDFVWSNKCNFKCSHCKPAFSSALGSDKRLKNFYKYNYKGVESIQDINSNTIGDVFDVLSEVETIHFNGGEPFLIQEHYDILDYLISIKRTDVKLWFHTNGSKLGFGKNNILHYLEIFKNVKISVSHDGFSKCGEFVRKGYSDVVFLKNYKMLQKYCRSVYPAFCVHALNLPYLTDTIDWYFKNNLIDDQQLPSINIITEPKHMNFKIHDEKTLEEVSIQMKNWLYKNTYPRRILHQVEKIANDIADLHSPNSKDNDSYLKLSQYLSAKKDSGQNPRLFIPKLNNFFNWLEKKYPENFPLNT